MLIGIIGAPNKGKSTLFSALTMNKVDIADYPFTTINPNKGVAYATKPCVEKELNTKCKARNSLCEDGTRMIPINVIDVAGLVEGAHEGKGMGNQFLNDLAAADAFMIVVDASGKTDPSGNPCGDCSPINDFEMVLNELQHWIFGIIKRHMPALAKSKDGIGALQGLLTGLKITKDEIIECVKSCYLTENSINWSDTDIMAFSKSILDIAKPIAIIANKSDMPNAEEKIKELRSKLNDIRVFECSAAMELALKKASERMLIDYIPGATSFNIINNAINKEQKDALEYMNKFLEKRGGTGVQSAINSMVFEILNNIVVYPVEDENKFTDHSGNVLPDAILLEKDMKAIDLAGIIHTDIAKGMLYAIDAKKKIKIGKDHVLKDNDVIKIVSTKK